MIVAVRVPYERRADLERATMPERDGGIEVLLQPDRRWFLARWLSEPSESEAEFVLQDGRCGCDFLSEDAPLVDGAWSMSADHRTRLASAVERFIGSIASEVRVSAMWIGDPVHERVTVSVSELGGVIRGGRLDMHTEYRVLARPAS